MPEAGGPGNDPSPARTAYSSTIRSALSMGSHVYNDPALSTRSALIVQMRNEGTERSRPGKVPQPVRPSPAGCLYCVSIEKQGPNANCSAGSHQEEKSIWGHCGCTGMGAIRLRTGAEGQGVPAESLGKQQTPRWGKSKAPGLGPLFSHPRLSVPSIPKVSPSHLHLQGARWSRAFLFMILLRIQIPGQGGGAHL